MLSVDKYVGKNLKLYIADFIAYMRYMEKTMNCPIKHFNLVDYVKDGGVIIEGIFTFDKNAIHFVIQPLSNSGLFLTECNLIMENKQFKELNLEQFLFFSEE